ncbi:MAG: ABC transporter permease [Bacteroidetes bacterium]|nr:ABC transporter permease [Bacteroidota bacterium]
MKEKSFFSGMVWKHFRKNKPALISLYVLLSFLFVALLAPILANDKPLYISYQGQVFFPAFSFSKTILFDNKETGKKETLVISQVDWKKLKPDHELWPLIPFYPGKSDPLHADYSPPSPVNHFLGTAKNGADVLSGLIHGTRISLSIGILSMLIASIIGIVLGCFAGYFGDHHLLVTRGSYWMMILGIFPAYFYGFYVRSSELSEILREPGIGTLFQFKLSFIIFTGIIILFYYAGKGLNRFPFFAEKKTVHADSIVSRIIEVFVSIPRLILIISIAAIAKPSFFNLVLIIGFTSWTEIARFIRAELLRTRNAGYIESSHAMGFSDLRIILKHALPNAIAPATVAIVFGIASAILVESGLSFLGIGVPQDVVTWGSLLFAGKENFEAWWLVVFPGLAIFLTVTSFNLLGDGLRDAMDVKGRG